MDDVADIAEQAEAMMDQVDDNHDGSISREEWRKNWDSVEALRQFRDKVTNETLKAEMVAKYGKEGPHYIPLYAFGNKMSFYRLQSYPTNPDERPEGNQNMAAKL